MGGCGAEGRAHRGPFKRPLNVAAAPLSAPPSPKRRRGPFKLPPPPVGGRWYAPVGRAARGTMGRGRYHCGCGGGGQEVPCGPAPSCSATPRPSRRGAL